MRVLVMGLLAAVTPLVTSACGRGDSPGPAARRFLGPQAVAVIRQADTVTVQQVKHAPPSTRPTTQTRELETIGEPVFLSNEQVERLRAILLSDDSYLFDIAKACIFNPDVRYRFTHGGNTFDAVVCFSCDQVDVGVRYATGETAGSGVEDIDPVAHLVRQLTRELLPGMALGG